MTFLTQAFPTLNKPVHQRKPGAKTRQLPADSFQNSRRVSKERVQLQRARADPGFLWTATGPHAGLFSASKSPLCSDSRFPLTHSSFLSAFPRESRPHGPGQASWEPPLKLWAAVPMSPLVAANAPQASLMLPTPHLPKAEKTRTLGEAEAVSWEEAVKSQSHY